MKKNLKLHEGMTRAKRGMYNHIRSEREQRTMPESKRWRIITRMGGVREYARLTNRITETAYQVWHIPTMCQVV